MNLNLIVDEEAFFAIFGRQSTSGFNQGLLNSIELPLLATVNANGQLVPPYAHAPGHRQQRQPADSAGRPARPARRQRDPAHRCAELRVPDHRPDPVRPARIPGRGRPIQSAQHRERATPCPRSATGSRWPSRSSSGAARRLGLHVRVSAPARPGRTAPPRSPCVTR